MWFDLFFTILFVFGVYYLLRNSYNINVAAERSKEAIYPKTEEEFKNIIIPNEWKEMKALTKNTKPYRFVQWGTGIAIVLLGILFILVLVLDLHSSFLSIVNFFVIIIFTVRLPGNLYILNDGIIVQGKYYQLSHIQGYKTEQIIRWHDLYGLDPRINDAYKLTFTFKKGFPSSNFVVVRELEQLEKIEALLKERGIKRLPEEKKAVTEVNGLDASKK